MCKVLFKTASREGSARREICGAGARYVTSSAEELPFKTDVATSCCSEPAARIANPRHRQHPLGSYTAPNPIKPPPRTPLACGSSLLPSVSSVRSSPTLSSGPASSFWAATAMASLSACRRCAWSLRERSAGARCAGTPVAASAEGQGKGSKGMGGSAAQGPSAQACRSRPPQVARG